MPHLVKFFQIKSFQNYDFLKKYSHAIDRGHMCAEGSVRSQGVLKLCFYDKIRMQETIFGQFYSWSISFSNKYQ
jgi:hypothetical protein